MRVESPDKDDLCKLNQVMKYLKGTVNLELTLTGDRVGKIQWFVDASYAVHDYCKGHNGAMLILGDGAVTHFSWEQKLNTKSFTESELVGIDDALLQML